MFVIPVHDLLFAAYENLPPMWPTNSASVPLTKAQLQKYQNLEFAFQPGPAPRVTDAQYAEYEAIFKAEAAELPPPAAPPNPTLTGSI